MSELIDPEAPMPLKEKFDYHTLIVKLPAGEGEYPTIEVQCRGVDKGDCMCTQGLCQVREQYAMVGWDAIRAAGDIELARISARMDWTDPEEPWLDVEP